MTDLIAIMSTLVDNKGRILIEGVYDEVAPLSAEEEALYTNITFDTVRRTFVLLLRHRLSVCRKPTVPKQV